MYPYPSSSGWSSRRLSVGQWIILLSSPQNVYVLPACLFIHCETLRSVTGSPVHVYGCVILPVRLGPLSTDHCFLVCDISTGPLLGNDFLRRHRVSLDFSVSVLRWRGAALPLDMDMSSPSSDSQPVCRLALSRDTTLAAGERIVVLADVLSLSDPFPPSPSLSSSSDPLLFEPFDTLPQRTGVVAARCLILPSSPKVPVQLFCPAEGAHLPRDLSLGAVSHCTYVTPPPLSPPTVAMVNSPQPSGCLVLQQPAPSCFSPMSVWMSRTPASSATSSATASTPSAQSAAPV